jgi:hypothetical protein
MNRPIVKPCGDKAVMVGSIVTWETMFGTVISTITTMIQIEFCAFALKSVDTAFSIDQNLQEKRSQFRKQLNVSKELKVTNELRCIDGSFLGQFLDPNRQ